VISVKASTFTKGSFYLGLIVTNLEVDFAPNDVNILSTVYQDVPTNLTGISHTGVWNYNTDVVINPTYTNCALGTVNNLGTANIKIKDINSTQTNGTRITNWRQVSIACTLSGGYVAIFDNNGVLQYYRNTDGQIDLPVEATGEWTWKWRKYGYNEVTGSFTVNNQVATVFTISPVSIPDIAITEVNSVTVASYTTLENTDKLADYLMYYATTQDGMAYPVLRQKTTTNVELKSPITTLDISDSNSLFTFNGTLLSIKAGSFTKGTTFAGIIVTGTIVVDFSPTLISITGDVSQNTPANITSVTHTGNWVYDTDVVVNPTFTSCTLGTVSNIGTAIINIRDINSTQTDGTNVTHWISTTITPTLQDGYLAVYDNTGTRQYYTNSDAPILLSSSATGTWSWKWRKYGYNEVTGTFIVNNQIGGDNVISPVAIPNVKVVDTLQNVSAYSELDTQQKIYDWYQYLGTSSNGINYAYDLDIQSGVLVSTGNKAITIQTTGASAGTYNGTAYVIKATTISGQKISTGGAFTLTDTTPIYPIQLAGASGTSNWLKIVLTANQYALLNGTTYITSNQ